MSCETRTNPGQLAHERLSPSAVVRDAVAYRERFRLFVALEAKLQRFRASVAELDNRWGETPPTVASCPRGPRGIVRYLQSGFPLTAVPDLTALREGRLSFVPQDEALEALEGIEAANAALRVLWPDCPERFLLRVPRQPQGWTISDRHHEGDPPSLSALRAGHATYERLRRELSVLELRIRSTWLVPCRSGVARGAAFTRGSTLERVVQAMREEMALVERVVDRSSRRCHPSAGPRPAGQSMQRSARAYRVQLVHPFDQLDYAALGGSNFLSHLECHLLVERLLALRGMFESTVVRFGRASVDAGLREWLEDSVFEVVDVRAVCHLSMGVLRQNLVRASCRAVCDPNVLAAVKAELAGASGAAREGHEFSPAR